MPSSNRSDSTSSKCEASLGEDLLDAPPAGPSSSSSSGPARPLLALGSRVRVRAQVASPFHGWGGVSQGEVGTLVGCDESSGEARVDFPGHSGWTSLLEELEEVEEDQEVGEGPALTAPVPLAPTDEGAGSPTMAIGSKVRVRPGLQVPSLGWGAVKPGDVGIVISKNLGESTVEVHFESQSSWTGLMEDLEVVGEGSDSPSTASPASPPASISSEIPKDSGETSSPATPTLPSSPGPSAPQSASPALSDDQQEPSPAGTSPAEATPPASLPEDSSVEASSASTSEGSSPEAAPAASASETDPPEAVVPAASSSESGSALPGTATPGLSEAPAVGSSVRFRPELETARYGDCFPGVGVVKEIVRMQEDGWDIQIDFQGCDQIVHSSDLLLATEAPTSASVEAIEGATGPASTASIRSEAPTVGAAVRIRTGTQTRYVFPQSHRGFVGTLEEVIRRREDGWDVWVCVNGLRQIVHSSDLEFVPSSPAGGSSTQRPSVGSRVRFRASVSAPRHGWASSRQHADIGEVIGFDDDGDAIVRFENKPRWICLVSELEVVGGSPKVGDHVRVRASISSPRYGWGGVRHEMVGRVAEIDDDGDLRVHFEGRLGGLWTGMPSEMEIAEPGEERQDPPSSNIQGSPKVGDHVRVRASVSSPRYGWGSVRHGMVGQVAQIDRDGDLRVRFECRGGNLWTALPSEVEITEPGEERPSSSTGGRPQIGLTRVPPTGTAVRFRSDLVGEPCYGYPGPLSDSNATTGIVQGIEETRENGWDLFVTFPGVIGNFIVSSSDLELVEPGDGSQDGIGATARGAPPNCPGGHGLAPFRTPHDGFECDICERVLSRNSEMWGCRRCNFDACKDCFGSEHRTEEAGGSPSTSGAGASSQRPTVGSRVRFKASVSNPTHGWPSPLRHTDIGEVVEFDDDGDAVVKFSNEPRWVCLVDELEIVEGDAAVGNVGIGDRVRVRAAVSNPRFHWGGVRHGMVGTVRSLGSSDDCRVDFPGVLGLWHALRSELEVVTEGPSAQRPSVGSRVRFRSSVSRPRHGWASSRQHADIGEVTGFDDDGDAIVRFANRPRWICLVEELEVVEGDIPAPSPTPSQPAFEVGSRVRVRGDVASPQFGWAGVSHGEVGTVLYFHGGDNQRVEVRFASHPSWTGLAEELELAPPGGDDPSPPAGHPFPIGSRVRVRRDITEPRFHWATVSPGDVGTVLYFHGRDDERVEVRFDSHPSWTGLVAEMELAPDGGDGPQPARPPSPPRPSTFQVGAQVRFRPGLDEPRFGWGGAVSPEEVGRVRHVYEGNPEVVEVNFDSHPSLTVHTDDLVLMSGGGTTPGTPPPRPTRGELRVGARVRYGSYSGCTIARILDVNRVLIHVPGCGDEEATLDQFTLIDSNGNDNSGDRPSPPSTTLQVGSQVRVRQGVEPTHGWGGVNPGDVGQIVRVNERGVWVDFSGHSEWHGRMDEMELANGERGPNTVDSESDSNPDLEGEENIGEVTTLLACTLCYTKKANAAMNRCGHVACSSCIRKWHKDKSRKLCPFCRKPVESVLKIFLP